MSINTCTHPNCNIQILPSWEMCKKHHGEAMKQRRLAKKVASKKQARKGKTRNGTYLDAQGKVRANMGLARLKERDRQAWLERELAEQEKVQEPAVFTEEKSA